MVIGGIAIIARGFERATKDVGVTFSGADVSIASLMEELGSAGIEPRIPNAAEFAATSQVLLVRHATAMVDVDVSRAWLPFELDRAPAAAEELIGSGAVQTVVAALCARTQVRRSTAS